jgi:hypothetical protein
MQNISGSQNVLTFDSSDEPIVLPVEKKENAENIQPATLTPQQRVIGNA